MTDIAERTGYHKWFISDDPFPETMLVPLDDDFPDPRVLTEYLEVPGAMLLVEPTDDQQIFAKRLAEEQLKDKADEIKAHFGQVGCLRTDGRLTWGRVVPSRISLEGLVEWVADRSRRPNRPDYPDRPPDVDTETNRAWIMHPIEVGSTASMIEPEHALETWPVYTLTVPLDDGVIKVLISYTSYKAMGDDIPLSLAEHTGGPGGAYGVRVKREVMNGSSSFDVDIVVDEDEPELWDRMELLLEIAAEAGNADEALIATFFDYEDMFNQLETAITEMREYYAAEMLRRPTSKRES